jgi:general secretion pathway protein K
MRQRGEKAGGRDNRGMALVLTLLVVAILTATVVEFAYGVYISTNALQNWQTAQRLSLAAKSATRLGARLITGNAALYPYTYPGHMEITQKIPFDEIDGTIQLRIEDENSKFNLNSLVYQNHSINTSAYDSLIRMLKALGLKKDIADRIVDWIDTDTEPRLHDSENSAKNGYLDSIDELLLIPGIDRESYEKLLPYITRYGTADGSPAQININGAGIPVLMSLSDSINADMAERVVRYRDATPFANVSDIFKVQGFDKLDRNILNYITVKGRAFHVLATAQAGNIKRIVESVIDISGGSRVVRYWKEF